MNYQCEECGKTDKARTDWRRFCSDRCRVRAWRRGQKHKGSFKPKITQPVYRDELPEEGSKAWSDYSIELDETV